MSALISAFGLDWRLLLVNIVNFGVLFSALWYFLYGPLTRMLESRRATIAQGVIDAENAKHQLAKVEEEKGRILSDAGREADDVLARARKAGGEKEKELIASGEAAATRITNAAEAAAIEIKDRALAESKQEIASLVVLGIEKAVVGSK